MPLPYPTAVKHFSVTMTMDTDSAITELFYFCLSQVSHILSHWLRVSSWFSSLSLPRFSGLHGDKSDRRGAVSLSKILADKQMGGIKTLYLNVTEM